LDQSTGGIREEDLAAVRRVGDPRGAMDIDPDVPLATDPTFAGVDAHAHADGLAVRPPVTGEPALRHHRRSDRVGGAAEDREERIAVRAHLDAPDPGDGSSDDPTVLLQDASVPVTDLLEETRGPLDVGE